MTSIGIIEDNEALRKSVSLLLEMNDQFEVVLSEESCDNIIEKLEKVKSAHHESELEVLTNPRRAIVVH